MTETTFYTICPICNRQWDFAKKQLPKFCGIHFCPDCNTRYFVIREKACDSCRGRVECLGSPFTFIEMIQDADH